MLSCRNLLPFSSKKDLRCEASSMASKNTLNVVMDEKDEAYAKREEKRRREKEEQMLNFVDIIKTLRYKKQNINFKRSIPVQEPKKLRSKKKLVKATLLVDENRLMIANLATMETETRAWFEKNQSMIRSRDV
jgi:hypothetical protein